MAFLTFCRTYAACLFVFQVSKWPLFPAGSRRYPGQWVRGYS